MNFVLLCLGLVMVNDADSSASRAVGAAVLGVGLSRVANSLTEGAQ